MHKDSTAIGVAPTGREAPHFVDTVAPQWAALKKALGRLGRAKELRDALLLARAARAGELVNVLIPDERDEALRDLSRGRTWKSEKQIYPALLLA